MELVLVFTSVQRISKKAQLYSEQKGRRGSYLVGSDLYLFRDMFSVFINRIIFDAKHVFPFDVIWTFVVFDEFPWKIVVRKMDQHLLKKIESWI